MKLVSYLVFATLLGATCSAAYAAGTDDLWEMNTTMNSNGQKIPLQTMNNCMIKGQDHPTPPDKTCKVTTQGGQVGKGSMVMECPGPPPTTIKVEGTRTATTMKGTMTVTGGSNMVMVQEFTGKIIGTCDAATFKPDSQSGMSMGGGMPGMNMPSFTRKSPPPKPSSNDAAAPNAANDAGAPAQKDTSEQSKDNSSSSMDLAKKALGGLLHF